MTELTAWFQLENEKPNASDIEKLRYQIDNSGYWHFKCGLLMTESQYSYFMEFLRKVMIFPVHLRVSNFMGFEIKIIREIRYD
jgi:hypothetical protein